jgi:hypothetical protein
MHLGARRDAIPVPENMRLLREGEVREDDEYTVGDKKYNLFGVRIPAFVGDALVKAGNFH